MDILGVGFSELIFVLIIALLVLGPKDMEKTGRTIGQLLNRIIRSDGWKALQQLRTIPTKLMRDANLEDAQKGASAPRPGQGTPAGGFSSARPSTPADGNSISPLASEEKPTDTESEQPKNA